MTVGEILAKDRDPKLDTVWLIWGQYYVKHYIRGNTSYLQPAKSYMHKSKSVAELAENIGLPEENLQETINHWNEMAAKGKDEDFGRGDLPYDRFMGDRFRDGHPNIEKVESPFQAVRVAHWGRQPCLVSGAPPTLHAYRDARGFRKRFLFQMALLPMLL
jgi:3-oxosteroid 1-dehydrogenase